MRPTQRLFAGHCGVQRDAKNAKAESDDPDSKPRAVAGETVSVSVESKPAAAAKAPPAAAAKQPAAKSKADATKSAALTAADRIETDARWAAFSDARAGIENQPDRD